VTTFTSPSGTSPFTDIGKVVNKIMTAIHSSQTSQSTRPGAVIYIPPGHYTLQTTAVIDASFITVKGSGHGFMSEAVRDDYGSPASWVEIKPGSSHVQIANNNQVGFLVTRSGTPAANGRLNGIVFQDFCLDGMTDSKPYLPGNGKTGIKVAYDSEPLRGTQLYGRQPQEDGPHACFQVVNPLLVSPEAADDVFERCLGRPDQPRPLARGRRVALARQRGLPIQPACGTRRHRR
jgi:hypothetical protein